MEVWEIKIEMDKQPIPKYEDRAHFDFNAAMAPYSIEPDDEDASFKWFIAAEASIAIIPKFFRFQLEQCRDQKAQGFMRITDIRSIIAIMAGPENIELWCFNLTDTAAFQLYCLFSNLNVVAFPDPKSNEAFYQNLQSCQNNMLRYAFFHPEE
ncbi:hypothetical protein H6764_02845 [Candidatus Nomurabacteria bacterium]|nr:hypothetical protein [Candidatus Nomurabacteria bacterium]